MTEDDASDVVPSLELAHSSPADNLADCTPSISMTSAGIRGRTEQPFSGKAEKNGACGSLNDLYFYGSSAPLELSSDSDRTSPSSATVMTDRVQHIASGIYAEFEAMIESYGLPVVERLMPMVIGLLENLDELYKDRSAYLAEIGQLRDQYSFTLGELEREKERRKLSELRLLQTEDTFDEEKKAQDEKIESLNASFRQSELRFQNMKDQVARMEAKEAEWKNANAKLHDRINELLRFNMDLTDQLKYSNRKQSTSGRVSSLRFGSSAATSPGLFLKDLQTENSTVSPVPENTYDATSGGFGFDEMPSTEEVAAEDDDLPDEPPTATYDNDTGAFAGMRKEIEVLIRENVELVETKNALNVVKDDLIAKVDALTLENTSLKESVTLLSQVRTNLQSELNSTDQLLGDARAEVDDLKERISSLSRKFEETGGFGHRKRFTRAEMSRVLSERNQYKERLMELQDAVRFTETLRASQKGHPELLIGLSSPGNKRFPSGTQSPTGQSSTRPLQTLQNFFSTFASAYRQEPGKDNSITPSTCDLTKFTTLSSHSWITLSRKHTDSPVRGWCNGIDQRARKDTEVAFGNFPVPLQCRTVGGIHGHRLEVVTALIVPGTQCTTDDIPAYRLWLIGRGPSQHGSNISSVRLTSKKGLVGQVHIFEPCRLRQSLHRFELDSGFIPIAATLIHSGSAEYASPSSSPAPSAPIKEPASICFCWEPAHLSSSKLRERCVVLSSNDGRFMVLRDSPISSPSESPDAEKNAWVHARFSVFESPLVANCLTSINSLLCVSLSNSSGTSHLTCFNILALLADRTKDSTRITLPLVPLPEGMSATGPMVMAAETSPNSNGRVWLGTAGGGGCHCFLPQTGEFLNSLSLPSDTPCLYAITLQPSTSTTPLIVWLAVSGNQASASVENDPDGPTTLLDGASRGIARVIGFDADKQVILYHFDLTVPLTTMLDFDHVTDPVDLTVCQLLYVPQLGCNTMWFATRAGCIGRLHISNIIEFPDSCAKLEVPPTSSVSLSCHGYRRPVCNLISVYEPVSIAHPQDVLVISVGHDYAHLRPQRTNSPSNSVTDSVPGAVVLKGMNKLRQMGSGAHIIVWKICSSPDGYSPNCNSAI